MLKSGVELFVGGGWDRIRPGLGNPNVSYKCWVCEEWMFSYREAMLNDWLLCDWDRSGGGYRVSMAEFA